MSDYELRCPDWAPPVIYERAAMLYADALEMKAPAWKLEAVHRLVTDPRMRKVWREIEPNPDFFRELVLIAWSRAISIRGAEIDDKVDHYRRMAEALIADARELGAAGLISGVSAQFLAAAEGYDGLARTGVGLEDPQIVQRERADPTLRGFVIDASRLLQAFYGERKMGTIATLYAVAYGADAVPRAQVRQLLRF